MGMGKLAKSETSLGLGNSSGICALRSNLAGACLLSRVKEMGVSRCPQESLSPSDSAEM